jgi:hypothetical protein
VNLHVDQHIAFEYPQDYLLDVSSFGRQYCLRRGNRFLFLHLQDRRTWLLLKEQFLLRPKRPVLRRIGGPAAPTLKSWIHTFNAHGFVGKACWQETTNPKGELIHKGVCLFVSRGRSRLYVQVHDFTDFTQGPLESVLESVAFPGEKAYEQARRQGPTHAAKPSPYAVELRHLAAFGHSPDQPKRTFNVAYQGKKIVEMQIKAVDDLARNEELLFDKVKNAVFRYYTQDIYPIVQDSGLAIEDIKQLYPQAATAEDIVPLVQFGSILVHEPRSDGTVPVGLRFDCDWDVEHGLGVRIAGLDIETVGTDEVALSPDLNQWTDSHPEE